MGYNYNNILKNEKSLDLIKEYAQDKRQLVKINQELAHCLWIILPEQRTILNQKGN